MKLAYVKLAQVVMNIAVRADPISYQLSQVNGIITPFKIH